MVPAFRSRMNILCKNICIMIFGKRLSLVLYSRLQKDNLLRKSSINRLNRYKPEIIHPLTGEIPLLAFAKVYKKDFLYSLIMNRVYHPQQFYPYQKRVFCPYLVVLIIDAQ